MSLRLPMILAVLLGVTSGCSLLQPNPDCRIDERCDAVLTAARAVTPFENARIVVIWGRGPVFHAEVHVCYADGRNVLVDVIGDDLKARLRGESWDNPPCR